MINKLLSGDYTMMFVARDYCNNTIIGDQIISFKIEPVLSFVPVVVLSLLIISLFGVSTIVGFRGLRSFKKGQRL